LSFRGRRLRPGTWLLATLAILALVAVAPVPALAAAPVNDHAIPQSILKPNPIPEPREMKPGGDSGFRLPFAAGLQLPIVQGWNSKFSHNGLAAYAYDIHMDLDTDVLAAAAGLVAFVHDGETACGGPELFNNANYVTIYHADGSATLYMHLTSVSVKVGDIVAAGQVIGKSGDTGYTMCTPHLHFARQHLGKGVTQSVPVYFQGYEKQELRDGDLLSVPPSACTPPSAAGTVAAKPQPQPQPTQPATSAAKPEAPATQPEEQIAQTQIQAAAADLGTFCGVYYGGALDQPAAFVERDAMLNFDWRSKGPGGYWLDSAKAGFAARWTGDFVFASAGTYTIGVLWSGAVRVTVDGVLTVDRWTSTAQPTEVLLSKALGAGIHRVDVEYEAAKGHGMLTLGWGRLDAE
jgi:murein DD-endopeptidase MepM/ murein hydrolase activator NlpD